MKANGSFDENNLCNEFVLSAESDFEKKVLDRFFSFMVERGSFETIVASVALMEEAIENEEAARERIEKWAGGRG